MGKIKGISLGLVFALTISSAVAGQGIQQWKTPSGAIYVGSNPPPGSEFGSTFDLSQGTRSSDKPSYEAPRYEVGPLAFHGPSSGTGHITGTLRNITDAMFNSVTVEFNLYNSGGALVGSAQTNVTHLEAGGFWSFDALTTKRDASNVKLMSVTAK